MEPLTIQKTKRGEDKYWELSKCLRVPQCPIDEEGTKRNLEFLIEIRHEISERRKNTQTGNDVRARQLARF